MSNVDHFKLKLCTSVTLLKRDDVQDVIKSDLLSFVPFVKAGAFVSAVGKSWTN